MNPKFHFTWTVRDMIYYVKDDSTLLVTIRAYQSIYGIANSGQQNLGFGILEKNCKRSVNKDFCKKIRKLFLNFGESLVTLFPNSRLMLIY